MASELKGKTLGILLATGPATSNARLVRNIVTAAMRLGVKIKLFLMDDGIYNLNTVEFLKLKDSGAEISVCTLNAEKRGIHPIPGIIFGSQFDNSEIVKNCDRYLAFFK